MKSLAVISFSLISTCLLIQPNTVVKSNTCPETNSYTSNLIEKVIVEDKYQTFREDTGLQGLTAQEIVTLIDSIHHEVCQTIRNDGFYTPEPTEQPISKTYFKSNHHYFSVVHFSDSIPKEENGTIKISTGPVGAIKVYDQNFNSIKADFIW